MEMDNKIRKDSDYLYQFIKGDRKLFVFFFIGFPILMILNNLDDHDNSVDVEELFIWILITLNSIWLIYLVVFKWLKQFNNRADYFLIAGRFILYEFILIFIETCLYWFLLERGDAPFSEAWDQTFNVFIVSFVNSGMLLGVLMFKKSYEAQVQLQKNKMLQKSNELTILKSQIDPHFLFNNLNTLDALVDIDSKKAKSFIEHLANLYQYILNTKDEDLIELQREIDFAKHYIYLIQVRFDKNYLFEIIDNRKEKKVSMLPTGAIQTAFENIVKHNHAGKTIPIKTTITIEDSQVIIRNNIRSKEKPLKSFGIGLSNLQSRYEILSNEKVEVGINDFYTIKLPLLNVLNS